MSEYITGEYIQHKCSIFLGDDNHFNFNPTILPQTDKHVNVYNINSYFNNPKVIFCYSDLLHDFSLKIHYFLNDFILISHNSDENITNDKPYVSTILNCNKLIKWYSQNISFYNEKLHFLPIGIANSQWPHGNLTLFNDISMLQKQTANYKMDHIFFNFTINTNYTQRQLCYIKLKDKLNWTPVLSQPEYLAYLSKCKFAICPEGNGYDSHRLWECFYLEVVPIVLNNNFIQVLKTHNLPMLILDNWDDFDISLLNYANFDFSQIYNVLSFIHTIEGLENVNG